MELWYALHTKPNSEYQVAVVLEERGITTYLPEIEAPKSRQKRKSKPFFPCYLFAQADLESIGLSLLQWTPGLRTIVTFGERPAPVSDDLIDLVRRKLGEIEASGGYPSHPFRPGDPVRITDGPFRDMLAIFEGPLTPAERVQVLLNILGRTSRVHVEVEDLEKAPGHADVDAPAPKRPRRTRGRGRRTNNQ
jgi:transcriptional antiterminator RfaH